MGKASQLEVMLRTERVAEWLTTEPDLDGPTVAARMGLSKAAGYTYLRRARRSPVRALLADNDRFWATVASTQRERFTL